MIEEAPVPPPLSPAAQATAQLAYQLAQQRHSALAISQRVGVSRTTVHRYVARLDGAGLPPEPGGDSHEP